MKKILLSTLLLSSLFLTNAFSEIKSDFEKQLFELDLKQKVPDDFIENYLKSSPPPAFHWYISKISKYPNYFMFFLKKLHPTGELLELYTFDNKGEIISKLLLSNTSDSDGGKHYWTEFEFLNDNTILIKNLGVGSGYKPTSLVYYKIEYYNKKSAG